MAQVTIWGHTYNMPSSSVVNPWSVMQTYTPSTGKTTYESPSSSSRSSGSSWWVDPATGKATPVWVWEHASEYNKRNNTWWSNSSDSSSKSSDYRNIPDGTYKALYQKYFGRDWTHAEYQYWKGKNPAELEAQLRKDYENASGTYYDWSPIKPGNNKTEIQLGNEEEKTEEELVEENKMWEEESPKEETFQLDSEIENYINSLDLDDAYKQILRTVYEDSYTSWITIKTSDDIDKIIKNATLDAESKLNPYYDKIDSQDLEDMKKQLEDIRSSASNYLSTEKQTYASLLEETRSKLRARWLTFDWENRKILWTEWALQSIWDEWTLQTKRRLWVEWTLADYQSRAQDLWTTYERKLGSWSLTDMPSIYNPYKLWNNYNKNTQSSLYTPTWNVWVWENQLEREAAIEAKKQANTKALTQRYVY